MTIPPPLGRSARALAAVALIAVPAAAQSPAAWSAPVAPVRLVGNIWYVGTRGLGAYLIRTPRGAILLDGTLPGNAPAIERSIAALGARLGDVRILLNTHAHFDHAGGLARLKRDTGARLYASGGDRGALEAGRHVGDNENGATRFPRVTVDRTLRDGEQVSLGGATMTAHMTPGHTPGCTTWTTEAVEAGRRLRVIFPCSLSVAGNRLVGNRAYPTIVRDYRTSFLKLGAMRADVVLDAHPERAEVLERQASGRLVDPTMLPRLVGAAREEFERELARQRG